MFAEIVGPTDSGDDAADLVLLHGGIGTGRYHWSKLVPGLSKRHRVHLPDLPGHGRTPLPPGCDYDRDLLVGAVSGYLEQLGPPVHVAAFSMGGHACLALATQQPQLFASLTLVGVSIREHAGLDGWRNEFDPDDLEARYPVWARHLAELHEPLGGPEAWKDVCRRDSKGLRVDVDAGRLGGLRCPLLLVRGDRDPAIEPAQYAEMRQLWPQADELVVPDGSHDVQLTRARLVEPALVDFLRRAGNGDPASGSSGG